MQSRGELHGRLIRWASNICAVRCRPNRLWITPLQLSAKLGQADIVQLLVENGAYPAIAGGCAHEGCTADAEYGLYYMIQPLVELYGGCKGLVMCY